MKTSKFISALCLFAIMITASCKKEEPLTTQQIPPSEIKSSLIYQYGIDLPIEGVTVNLRTCNGSVHWGSYTWECDDPHVTYRTVLTDINGSFSYDVDSTWSYEFYKQGYWSDSFFSSGTGSPNLFNNTPNKHFLIKEAWLKIHFTNVGSPNSVDSILISAGPGPITTGTTPFANLYLPVYGSSINNTTYTKAYGDATNYVRWITTHNGNEQDSTTTFYLNAGDTTLVEINY